MNSDIAAILVIRLGALGDVLMTTPVLRELRIAFPEARLHYLTRERYDDLLAHNPCVDRVHTVPQEPGVPALLRAGWRLRGFDFDLVIDLHRSFRTHLVRTTLGARSEIVFRGELGRGSRPVTRADGRVWPSLAERFLATLTRFGVQPQPERLELHVPESALDKASSVTRGLGRPLVAIAPGARWPTKRWIPEGFAAAGDALKRERHATIMLLGDAYDAPVCDRVRSIMQEESHAPGPLSILETAAVLEKCRLLLCNDSGLFHVARAMGTPAVAVFGPTGPQMGYYPWEPYARSVSLDMPCSPCTSKGTRRCPKRHFRCMRDLSPHSVLRAADEIWGRA